MVDPTPMIERVARAIATGCRLDPDEISPKAAEAGHEIPEWMFFVPAAREAVAAIRKPIMDALKPFADCAAELDGSEDVPRAPEGEWAKFRLLTDDYRRARDVVAMVDAALAEA